MPNKPVISGDNDIIEYVANSQYIWNMGLMPLPIGGSVSALTVGVGAGGIGAALTQTATITQVHAPYCIRKISWSIKANGQKPVAPTFDLGNYNEILIGKTIGNAVPIDSPSGSEVYGLAGEYIYLMLTPPSDGDSLPLGQYPYDQADAVTQIVPGDFATVIPGTTVANQFSGVPFANNALNQAISQVGNRKPILP